MVIRLRQGWPYVFRIRNRDDEGHVFKAHEFFRNVAVIQSSVDGEVEDNPCLRALWLSPGKTAELRLVASVDGYYEFEDLPFFALTGFYGGPQGVIIIEINDNPSIDHDVEGAVLKDEIWRRIISWFSTRLERRMGRAG